jgi:hypothetical protein
MTEQQATQPTATKCGIHGDIEDMQFVANPPVADIPDKSFGLPQQVDGGLVPGQFFFEKLFRPGVDMTTPFQIDDRSEVACRHGTDGKSLRLEGRHMK